MADMKTSKILGMLGQFNSASELMKAAEKFHEAGYKKYDCHSPFPVHGMDHAMGLKRSQLGWIVGIAAIIGTTSALGLQWWTSTIDYPLVISGKPFFSYQAYTPITFALGVLLSAFAALIGMLALNGLPRFNHPVFHSRQFAKATDDGFFVSVESSDPLFDQTGTKLLFESLGGVNIEILEDDENV